MRSWLPPTLLAVCALALRPAPLPAADVVLIVNNSGSLTTQEGYRKSGLESWGHAVTLLSANSSQSSYDAAVAAADAVYVTEEIFSGDVGYKLREAPIGVVCEERALDMEFGFASTDGYEQNVNFVEVADNAHPITSSFSTGSLQVTTHNTDLICLQGSFAPGGQVLANLYSAPCLMAVESGGTLANSHNSSSTAFGRRVRLPFGGNNFDGALSNASGQLLVEKAVEWAATASAGSGVHLKLEETSGTIAANEVDGAPDGEYVGGPTLGESAKRGAGIRLSRDSGHDRISLPGEVLDGQSQVTITWWMKTSTYSSQTILSGANSSQANTLLVWFRNGSKFEVWNDGSSRRVTIPTVSDGQWRHFAYTHNRATGVGELFINGESAATLSHSSSGSGFSIHADGLQIGEEQDSVDGGYVSSQAFEGVLDDFRLYHRILTQDEIVQLYGLVGHWRLDEASGTTVSDSSPSSAHGSFGSGGPAWASGVRSGAIAIESDTVDRIDIPSIDVSGDQLTLSAWVKPETLLHEGRVLIKSAGNTASTQTWGMTIDDSGDADFRVKINGTFRRLIVPGVIEAGRWQLLTGVYDGSEMRLYIDGQLGGTKTISGGGGVTAVPSHGLTIGDSPIGGRPVDGLIDDVRVYSYALGDWEIGELYGLVGHWKFDETAGATAADSSHFANDAALITGSAAWNYGARGHAVSLNGSTAFRPTAEFDPPPVGCIALWMRQNALPTGHERILGMNGYWELVTNPTGAVRCELDAQGGGWQFASDPEFLTPGQWRHVIACYDSENDLHQLYLDGQLFSSGPFACNDEEPGTLTLGGRTGSPLYFNGDLDDVRIYNRWLTPHEIAEIYGLVAHWRLDETSGGTAYDSSGMDHHATLTGAEGWVDGLDGGGFYFDYTNGEDYFLGPNTDLLDRVNQTEYTMMAVYKPDGLPAGSGSAYDGAHSIVGKAGYHMRLGFNDTGRPWAEHWTSDTSWRGAYSPLNYPPGAYHHIAATVSATLGQLRLYVDGEEVNDYTWTPGLGGRDYGSQRWQIGIGAPSTGGGSWGHPAKGVIDDVRIYNRVLSAEEVQSVSSSFSVPGLRIIRWVEAR